MFVVIVTFNNAKTIARCLASVVSQKDTQAMVIDNHSTDRTVEIVKQQFKKVEVVLLPKNSGYAGGNNIGIEKALAQGADYVLILNPDTVLEKGVIEKLVRAAKERMGKGVFGPQILCEDKKHIWSAGGALDTKRYTAQLVDFQKDAGSKKSMQEHDFISGTCMLLPQKLLQTGLRFREQYFLYYEDVEFCLRARMRGFPSIIVPSASIVHSETSQTFPLKNYYLARNHLLFVERNAPLPVKLREFIRLPKTIFEHTQTGDAHAKEGIRDYFLRRFGRYRY